MSAIIRLLPLFLLLCLVDYTFYQMIWEPVGITNSAISQMIFYAQPFLSVLLLSFFPRKSNIAIEDPTAREVLAGVSIFYFSKGFALLVTAVLALLNGAVWGVLKLIGSNSEGLATAQLFIKSFGLAFALFFLVILIYGMVVNRYRFKVRKVSVPIPDLPSALEGFSVVQISDIHSGSFTNPDYLEKGVQMINELEPDLFCFTGDLVNNYAVEIEPYIDQFKKIKAKYGSLAILGNHDYGDYARWSSKENYVKNLDRLVENYNRLGWKLLRDESVNIKHGDAALEIVGVENISASGRFKKYGDFQKAISQVSPSDVTILLSHDPSHWRAEVLDYPEIDLCLSGHTHGMQFGLEIGNWFKWSPVKWAYKEWAGLYNQGSQFLYVNRGFGFLGYPGRVGILPEITYIEFKRASS